MYSAQLSAAAPDAPVESMHKECSMGCIANACRHMLQTLAHTIIFVAPSILKGASAMPVDRSPWMLGPLTSSGRCSWVGMTP